MSGAIGKIIMIGLAAQTFRFATKVIAGRIEGSRFQLPGVTEFFSV